MKVVILSDRKPGHYKQSLGIVDKIPECQAVWLEIQFRRKWRDNLLRVFMCVFGGASLPISLIHTLLRWSLIPESYHALVQLQTADIILSTGSSVAAVNLLLGRILGAKTVTCRRPSPVGVRYFDLAILPMISWHQASRKDNICRTIGVPNPISPDLLDVKREQLKKELHLSDCPRIGVLLGGTDRHETITIEDAEWLSEICEATAERMNVQIFVTTSRRTPSDVTEYLVSTVKDTDWCPFFMTPDTSSELEDPYQAILALSDLLIVTADSFSMVCEAASSGRSVAVLTLSHKGVRPPKRHEVYRYMEESSIVNQCRLDELETHIINSLISDVPNKSLQDTETAVEAIRQLVAIR
ncbi:hypothetical protein C6500_19625 [Candidatus Poribacteria bacterium]|nr:MAG: hypothetical protein C6500_19625 [Candidatus Poribacteria bacterium]